MISPEDDLCEHWLCKHQAYAREFEQPVTDGVTAVTSTQSKWWILLLEPGFAVQMLHVTRLYATSYGAPQTAL